MGNILKVSFGANRQAKTRPLWQYDYGQKLVLYGVDLPYTYEVHFSKSQESGTAITVLGDADGVEIPNDLLQNTGNVYAWLYLHTEGYDGETVYRIEIPVKSRPHAEDVIPPEQQTAIEQAVIALNNAIGRAEESAESAAESAESAHATESAVQEYAESAGDSATSAGESASSAAESARNAENARSFAESAQSAAEDAADVADDAAILAESWAVGGTGTRDGEDTNNSKYYAERAKGSADSAEQIVRDFDVDVQGIISDVEDAGLAQVNRIEEEGTRQVGLVQDKGQEQITSVNSAGSTQVAAVNEAGGTQVGAVEEKGQQVLDSIPEDYTELSGDVSQLKADLSDKDALTVGTAKQLVGDKFTEDKVPYLFRQSGGGLTVGNRKYLDAVVGGTVVWNQLAPIFNSDNWRSEPNVTVTYENGIATITSNTAANGILTNAFREIIAGHKYLITVDLRSDTNISNIVYGSQSDTYLTFGANATASWNTFSKVLESRITGNRQIYLYARQTYANLMARNAMFFDLTAMFGTEIADYIYALEQANAGDGVAFFKKLFPNDYYAYNPGELISVSGVSAHETVGFNQWDEEWKVIGNHIGSKNPIPCKPNTAYYMKTSVEPSNGLKFWTKDMVRTGSTRYNGGLFTTPANCHFMTFEIASAYGTVYKNDICINISDPSRNGTYEPYVKRSYSLDSTLTLRGIPKLVDGKIQYDGDRYLPDGTVERRYGVVDLGTLDYSRGTSSSTGLTYFDADTSSLQKRNGSRMVCSKFVEIFAYGTAYGQMYASGRLIVTFYADYPDAATFKAAMSGIMLIYELATPTIETAEPYRSDQLLDAGGTEEFVSTSLVPVGHETRYPEDLVKKLESLPWDMSMIAPVETGTTASQAYAIGKYFILNDQFCKAKTAIASGATFTLNTNYEVTTVAAELYSALNS